MPLLGAIFFYRLHSATLHFTCKNPKKLHFTIEVVVSMIDQLPNIYLYIPIEKAINSPFPWAKIMAIDIYHYLNKTDEHGKKIFNANDLLNKPSHSLIDKILSVKKAMGIK